MPAAAGVICHRLLHAVADGLAPHQRQHQHDRRDDQEQVEQDLGDPGRGHGDPADGGHPSHEGVPHTGQNAPGQLLPDAVGVQGARVAVDPCRSALDPAPAGLLTGLETNITPRCLVFL